MVLDEKPGVPIISISDSDTEVVPPSPPTSKNDRWRLKLHTKTGKLLNMKLKEVLLT